VAAPRRAPAVAHRLIFWSRYARERSESSHSVLPTDFGEKAMKAVVYTHSRPITDPDALLDRELPDPADPTGHDLLVEIRAISVNPVDTKVRKRADPVGEARVLGWDAAGVVRARGPEVSRFHLGDHVFYAGSIIRPGSNAELQLVDERIAGHKPKVLSFAEAAALPLTSITAWEMLFDRLQTPMSHGHAGTLLIIGGAGGVGSIAIQLARVLTGVRVVATASRAETRDWCLKLGAHDVIDHNGDMPAQMKKLGIGPVERIFCTNATDKHWKAIVQMVAPQGRVGLIDDPDPVDVRELKQKSASLHWESMFVRSSFNTPDISAQHDLLERVSSMVDAGTLRTTLAENYGRIDALNVMRAHAAIESNTTRGKIVLEGF
jgi:NADPH:quinone reductase